MTDQTQAAAEPSPGAAVAEAMTAATLDGLALSKAGPLLVGLSGAQGSGKSTAAAALESRLAQTGLRTASLSIDDLYLSGHERRVLASRVHPLLATRGVPGTHDLAPLWTALEAARRGEPFELPRFDKSLDEPWPRAAWPRFPAAVDVILFEGWCVGAAAEADAALDTPLNALERRFDADGRWRRWVNGQLRGPYADLFATVDLLGFIAAPGLEVVTGWRREQERALPLTDGVRQGRRMDDAEVARFVEHFARITAHMLREAPLHADLTFRLDEARRLLAVERRGRATPQQG